MAVSTSQTTSNEESKNASYCAYLREQKELTQSNLEATVQRLDDGEEDVYETIEGIEGQLASIDAQLAADCGGVGETNSDINGGTPSDPGSEPQSRPFIWKNDNPLEKPTSFHRSLMGANLDVVQALDIIEFEKDKLADAGMRNCIAYIRRWKRSGVARQTQIDTSNDLDFPANFSLDYETALENTVGTSWNQPIDENLPEFAQGIGVNPFNPNTVYNISPEGAFNPSSEVVNSFAVAEAADYSFVPVNSFREATPTSTIQGNIAPTSSPVSQPRKASSAGKVISANPGGSGFGGFLTRLTNNLLNIPSQPPLYSGKGGPSNAKIGSLEEGVWQFLFNPSELQLRAGPDYNKAQTWGVSDKENSGQPLSWRNNKNAELKFNKVLLNGYIFGRRVEELEQGILDLFMSRDGGGQDGPDVLEFVWGQKVFGPCVIKDIEISEKAWDGGLVVNAEVSFTLEQIPEWTINDGAVEVYNPSQLPLSQAESIAAQTDGNVGDGTTSPGEGTPRGGTPDQNAQEPNNPEATGNTYKTCQKAYYFIEVFQQVEISGNQTKFVIAPNNQIEGKKINARRLSQLLEKYKKSYDQAKSSLGSGFTRRIPTTQTPVAVGQAVNELINSNKPDAGTIAVDRVRNAALRAKAAAGNIWDSGTCKNSIKNAQKYAENAKNANNKKALCEGITVGKPCNIGAGNFATNPCNQKRLICKANGFYAEIAGQ